MSLEQTIKDTVMAESVDLDMRLQQLVRAGLMPSNTIPLLRKAISKIQGGYPLQGAERDVMANFLNSMMFIVLGDDSIFNKARVGAKSYATEAKEKQEYDYEGDMAMSQLKSIIANSQRMHDSMSEDTNLPEWVQSKITLAEDYISTAANYLQSEVNEGKRGLWDNIHAKRKRIKAGSGERMRKPGSEGAPSAADLKNSRTEEVEQIDEVNANQIKKDIDSGMSHDAVIGKHANKRTTNTDAIRKVIKQHAWDKRMKKEEVELDEATYFVHTANKAHHVNKKIPTGKKDAMGQALMTSKVVKSFPYGDSQSKQTSSDQHKAAHDHAKKLNASMKNEEVEQIDELSKATRKSYGNKASDQVRDYVTDKPTSLKAAMNNMKREKGLQSLQKRKTNEESEQIDEISSDMAYRYLKGKRERDYDISPDGKSSKLKKPMTYAKMNKDAKSSVRAIRTIEKAKKGILHREEKESRRGEARADIAAITQMNESYKTTFNAALTQYGIKSPSELDEEKRKEFFNFVDQNYKQGDN